MKVTEFTLNGRKALESFLSGLPQTRRASTARDLLAPVEANHPRRFLLAEGDEPAVVRFAEYHDVEADAVFCDGLLGSLGFAFCVPLADPDTSWLRERIDRAAYVRHLLMEQIRPGAPDAGKSPYAVEVVFVISAATAAEAATAEGRIGEVLRRITRDESYLDAVGINVWTVLGDPGAAAKAAPARRAFSWLLQAAAEWYQPSEGQAADPLAVAPAPAATATSAAPAATAAAGITAVELEDFRVAGRRRLQFDEGVTLHLVFGQNGSGKSSLAEALELVLTGKIKRLERDLSGTPPGYDKVLTHRTAFAQGRHAQVRLSQAGGQPELAWNLSQTVLSTALAPHLAPGSFRLDQTMADELAQGDVFLRAREFLRAFFPTERAQLEEFDALNDQGQATFNKLPEHVRSRLSADGKGFDPKRALTALQPLVADPVEWKELLQLLPAPPELLAALPPLLPGDAAALLRRTDTALSVDVPSLLPALDDGLAKLTAGVEARIQALNRAADLLEAYGEASVSAFAPGSEALGILLNQWLESVALADLLEREDQILSALEAAHAARQEIAPERRPALADFLEKRPVAERRQMLERLWSERDDLRQRLSAYAAPGERRVQEGKPDRPLSEFQPDSLDQAAQWGAFGDAFRTISPALGAAVRQAFRQGSPVEVLSGGTRLVNVGMPGWGKELLAMANRTRKTLRDLSAMQSKFADPASALSKLWPTLRELHEVARKLSAMNQEFLSAFLFELQPDKPLGRAVNEVMALLTPARWAYQDLNLRLARRSGGMAFEVTTHDGVPADQRLNTAELNTLAIALFLLCACHVPNPLRLIVLDDPLQNMDELTVTTVARGMGRLLRLWRTQPRNAPWRVLMLLHDENSLERFRSEVDCVGYILPWLSPHDLTGPSADQDPGRAIKVVKSLLAPELQPLLSLVSDVPPRKDSGDRRRGPSEPPGA